MFACLKTKFIWVNLESLLIYLAWRYSGAVRLSKTGVTYLGWFKGIICRKVYGQKENTSLEGTVGLRKENEINKVRKHKIYPDDPLVSLKKKKLD